MNIVQRGAIFFATVAILWGIVSAMAVGSSLMGGVIIGSSAFIVLSILYVGICWVLDGDLSAPKMAFE